MSRTKNLSRMLSVLDARIEQMQLALASASADKRQLGEHQKLLVSDAARSAQSLDAFGGLNAASFRFHESRMLRLRQRINELQPALAHSAIAVEEAKADLKTELRKQLGVQMLIEHASRAQDSVRDEGTEYATLFELRKRL
ncbi:hypothetical protein [Marivita hallyeonensis]|uniref:Flagellar FliJ protein n=1 Tax=Marivita hallyeonensis TaxID=996342 RepID=A0A1M5UND6_9RHOB|nr:hypothetical protein [Marivita hallyeonensis]SHH64243.1 hypothetical protein SAMN05443551_2713 [Marivita hallyeonensis]